MAASGMPLLKNQFTPWFPNFPKISPCYPYRCKFAGCEGNCNLSCARQLEQAIIQAGPENVAAFIAEPVNSAGIAVGIPGDNYLNEIREICDKYDVLFIADEVITGFGRTGKYFAVEHWNVVPDIIVFGKGASSGYSPLGGVLMRDKIYDSFRESCEIFAHVFTYVDNPVAMRIGLEVLAIIEEEKILDEVSNKETYFLEKTESLKKYSIVGDIRAKGMLWGIELVKNYKTKEPFPAELKVGQQIADYAFKNGLSITAGQGSLDWVDGDDIRLSPPLTTTYKQIDEIIAIIDKGIMKVQL
jgi:adenosylmethionine-8-amino-7-oxononanoate aminotransferase